MRQYIVGNWKMNGLRQDANILARELASQYADYGDPGFEMVLCPPFTLLHLVGEVIAGSGIQLGAQDCAQQELGAFTGSIAARMLEDIGCRAVILGHSERRQHYGEIDLIVAEKAKKAQDHRLTTIICVGETLEEREAGAAFDICTRQILGSVPGQAQSDRLMIAYEPVWAIGTGKTPSEEDIAAMHSHMRAILARILPDASQVPLLYGGSVKPGNARQILALPNVNGALVGGASLDSESFWQIAKATTAVPFSEG